MTCSSSAQTVPDPRTRRQWLVTLAAGALLAGCASRRPVSEARGGAATPGAGAPRRVPAPLPPTQAPLALDPAGRDASVARAMLLVNTPYRYGGNTP